VTDGEGETGRTRTRPLAIVADDEPTLRELLAEILEEAGFRTMTAADGVQMLELVAAHRPDLIVADVMMPRMDGFTAIARLRGAQPTADIPVIVVTAHADPAFQELSAGLGVTAHLTKPFAPIELIDAARRAVPGAAP
jgi:CheY-like chemotaxis protein